MLIELMIFTAIMACVLYFIWTVLVNEVSSFFKNLVREHRESRDSRRGY